MVVNILEAEHSQDVAKVASRRRTFAIISHPDAGKTTLTEKLLLFGGAIQEAGAVKAKRAHQNATSDWMELEKQRGISITSTALQFEYKGYCLNLLDTPGHADFSEDTYRTLAAADNAVMVIDSGKGIEERTRKLFDVCRMRGLPILTFINKCDRPSKDPLELLDEVEKEFGLKTYPVNYPIGTGERFKGIVDRQTRLVHLFERTAGGRTIGATNTLKLDDPSLPGLVGQSIWEEFQESFSILDELCHDFDQQDFLDGIITPVFFGSAMNNFGIENFLDYFVNCGAEPRIFNANVGRVGPEYPEFTGFVFKLQANMDPRHRDCIAFLRICSGVFSKDMQVFHSRTGKSFQLSQPKKLFGSQRETLESAYPGDVIGLTNPGMLSIGDTVSTIRNVQLPPIPSFAPELFACLRNLKPSKYKQFHKGMKALQEEGAIQILQPADDIVRNPILAAVGQLQLEVVQYRLQAEYDVDTAIDSLPYTLARWVVGGWEALGKERNFREIMLANDLHDQPVMLFKSPWSLKIFNEKYPDIELSKTSTVNSFEAVVGKEEAEY
jgi:peptide chain release factor 3